MANQKIITFVMIILCLLASCGTNESGTNQSKQDVELTKISTAEKIIDQKEANKAKDILRKKENITSIRAVNTDKQLIITVEVPHHERFQLAQTRKDLQKEMKNEFPEMKVELSTDRKIIIELEQLEEKIQKKSINKKELKKEVKNIIKLSKEQT